jgi:ribosomal protein L13E
MRCRAKQLRGWSLEELDAAGYTMEAARLEPPGLGCGNGMNYARP